MSDVKRKSKAATPKTEIFAMRFDPKTKYLAEVAARKQRRSLSNFMEWAVELALKNTFLEHDSQESVWDMSTDLWDVDEADRFIRMAFIHPELLTYDEQVLWKVICEWGNLWKGKKDQEGKWQWKTDDLSKLNLERLRRKWKILKSIASGESEESVLVESDMQDPVLDISIEPCEMSEVDSLVTKAFSHPERMNSDEKVLWKVICERGNLWKGKKDQEGKWQWKTNDVNKLIIERLRRKWQTIKKIASGEKLEILLDEQD